MKETHKLSIYLIKESYSSFVDCLRQNSEYTIKLYELKRNMNIKGIIYVAETIEKNSKCHKLFQAGTNENIPELTNSSK